jgi:hypothetical protein
MTALEETEYEVLRKVTESNGDDTRLKFPEELQEALEADESVHWSYDIDYGHLIVSNHSLRDDIFIHEKEEDVYDNDYIRPPHDGEIIEKLHHLMEISEDLFYLASEEMLTNDDPRSVFVLTNHQLKEIWNNPTGDLANRLRVVPNYTPCAPPLIDGSSDDLVAEILE